MKARTRTAAVAAAALMALTALTGCSSDGSGGTDDATGDAAKGAIAWSFASQDVAIWASQLELMKPLVEAAGYEFLTDNPSFDVQTQVNDWQSWISRGDVKAIGGFPVDAASMANVTADATTAGIPIVSYAVTWDGVTATTEISNYDAGFAVGEAAGKWIADEYGTTEVSVALLADTQTQLGIDQLKGLTEGVQSTDAKVKVYPLEATTRDVGYSVAQSQLTADPDTKVWLGIGADMVLGARQALIDSGVAADAEGYYVSATDANAEVLQLIESKTDMWKTSFAWRAEGLAQANVDLLLAVAAGEKPDNITVGVTQVTADNVGDFANNG
ncbi:sugar ABC transporter substrate-binding protein [Microbacterium sp.]|uniref:sugar ABC transporter substrate-binding protein n=1 Tax=Microbacterium sp. TaxID=51671 RepID=UPI0039E6ECE8